MHCRVVFVKSFNSSGLLSYKRFCLGGWVPKLASLFFGRTLASESDAHVPLRETKENYNGYTHFRVSKSQYSCMYCIMNMYNFKTNEQISHTCVV